MLIFYWPWFACLLFLPLATRFILPASNKKNNPHTTTTPNLYFPALNRIQSAFAGEKAPTAPAQHRFVLLLAMLWLFLVLALMRPQWVDKRISLPSQGYDLMLAVDISGSMRALDFSSKHHIVSRLQVAKVVVSEFVKKRRGDRVGLILFGEQAYLHVPLTLDTLSVSRQLNNTVSGMAGDATSIGDAIGLAVQNLRHRPQGSRVIILLTDGQDTASSIPPQKAAQLAKQYGIRIYTIAIGNAGLVPYPSDKGGVIMAEVPLDEQRLKEIAYITGGQYFRATDENTLQSIYNTINTLEKTTADDTMYLIQKPLYYYPLGIAAALFLLLTLMPLYQGVRHVA